MPSSGLGQPAGARDVGLDVAQHDRADRQLADAGECHPVGAVGGLDRDVVVELVQVDAGVLRRLGRQRHRRGAGVEQHPHRRAVHPGVDVEVAVAGGAQRHLALARHLGRARRQLGQDVPAGRLDLVAVGVAADQQDAQDHPGAALHHQVAHPAAVAGDEEGGQEREPDAVEQEVGARLGLRHEVGREPRRGGGQQQGEADDGEEALHAAPLVDRAQPVTPGRPKGGDAAAGLTRVRRSTPVVLLCRVSRALAPEAAPTR